MGGGIGGVAIGDVRRPIELTAGGRCRVDLDQAEPLEAGPLEAQPLEARGVRTLFACGGAQGMRLDPATIASRAAPASGAFPVADPTHVDVDEVGDRIVADPADRELHRRVAHHR